MNSIFVYMNYGRRKLREECRTVCLLIGVFEFVRVFPAREAHVQNSVDASAGRLQRGAAGLRRFGDLWALSGGHPPRHPHLLHLQNGHREGRLRTGTYIHHTYTHFKLFLFLLGEPAKRGQRTKCSLFKLVIQSNSDKRNRGFFYP